MKPDHPPNSFSFLIRTFNSEIALKNLLPALLLEIGDELMIVDSGSMDDTLVIAADYGAQIVNAIPPFNYSRSLNLGFSVATNPWVYVLSSHVIPVVPDIVSVFRATVSELATDVVVAYGPSTLDGQGYKDIKQISIYNADDIGEVLHYCGNANTVYRRQAWQKLHFDESVRTEEDRIWALSALKTGNRICLVAHARTINRNRYSLLYMYRKGFSDSKAGVYNPITVSNLIKGIGSRCRQFLAGSMPIGSLARTIAQHIGAFSGSYQPRDNTPNR